MCVAFSYRGEHQLPYEASFAQSCFSSVLIHDRTVAMGCIFRESPCRTIQHILVGVEEQGYGCEGTVQKDRKGF